MTMKSTSLSRRNFLKTGAAAGLAALSPIVVFRANAAAGVGELLMAPATANPNGVIEKLFVLKGDPLAGPITAIVTEEGNPVPAQQLPEGERRVVRLMHFNDMHNHITDMHAKRGDTHRLSQMVKHVKEARAAAADNEIVLFVSAGDDHTGSIFDELMGWSPDTFVADAGYRTYSAAGVDVSTLGNHEFDRGAALLRHALKADANFPVLSANVHSSQHLKANDDYTCAAVAEVKGLRVGLIGLTTAVDTRVGQPSDPTLAVASPVEAVKNVVPALSEISDVIVILSHCGYGSGAHASGKASLDRRIGEGDFDIAAAASPLTDKPIVLIGGHSHTELNSDGIDENNLVEGLLITQAKANGSHLGEIAMSVGVGEGRDKWFSSVGLRPIKRRDDRVAKDDEKYASLEHDGDFDAEFEAAHVQPLITALDDKLAEQIGMVEDNTLISTERTIADRYIRETAIGNFMNDALVERSASFPGGTIDFALFNATGLSSGVAKGPLSFKQWYDVMPYADAVHVATLTGAEIKQLLDNNAKRILRPDEVNSEIDLAGFVQRGFLHFSKGLRYTIDLGKSASEARAIDITLNGKPIEEVMDEPFTLAINTYISLGGFGEAWNGNPIGGGVPGEIASMDLRGLDYDHTGLVYRNEIIGFIRDAGTVGESSGVVLDGRLKLA